MSNKLLNKTLRPQLLFAFILFALSIPTYFLMVDWIWLKELDENNQLIAQRIENEFNKQKIGDEKLVEKIQFWNEIQSIGKIEPAFQLFVNDSVYTIRKPNLYSTKEEVNRFRCMVKNIKINNKEFTLTIESNVEESEETLSYISLVTFFLFLILLLGFWILNQRLSKEIWQPFFNSLEKLKNFDLTTRQSIYFDKTDTKEFEELNQTLQKLIEKNISVYTQQKEFIENASHELQTPLAVLKSKLNLLLQNKNLTNEQSEIINAIELTLSRVSRINKNLLLLAKIENEQFASTENIEISELIKETQELFSDYINDKRISVSCNLVENFRISINKTLFEIFVSNLLINAIIHNTINGTILINLNNKILTISNTGNSSLNPNKLFERFAVSSSQTTNSGLGLAIIKEICNRYQWQISYSFKNNLHSFSVEF